MAEVTLIYCSFETFFNHLCSSSGSHSYLRLWNCDASALLELSRICSASSSVWRKPKYEQNRILNFFDTKIFRNQNQYLFQYQFFFFKTDTDTIEKHGKVSKARSFETVLSHSGLNDLPCDKRISSKFQDKYDTKGRDNFHNIVLIGIQLRNKRKENEEFLNNERKIWWQEGANGGSDRSCRLVF